jgi:hypothetical protein
MKFFVGVTDNQWFDYLRRLAVRLSARPSELLDEANFWQPGGGLTFEVMERRNPFFVNLQSAKP